MIGQTISHYRISSRLGAGGMGEVYLAEDTRLDRTVALKFLPAAMWNESEAQQRLIREAKAASKLDHPNIVTIYGIEEFEGRPFIVMAHVKGVTLNEYCTSAKRSIPELIELALQMADGLQHAHDAGVIHRDLKPGNILVDEQGRVRVLDFGIARMRGTSRLTQTGSTVGTLAYSPPELAQGEEAEPTSDVYSLGVVLYQMLTGRLPFEADHEAALLYSILHEPPNPMTSFSTEIPSALQNVVLKCLEKRPDRRFPNCRELARELRKCSPKLNQPPGATLADKPSIAVLPFANMSADPENEYFSDGLAEELLNTLAKNPALKVTGRTSSFAFKGKQEDLREIGQKLGVETLLEGSVRKAGNRVRITTQLVKASDGFHLWSETYDRVLDDIFAVQDDIARSVATAMNVTLLGKMTPPAESNPAKSASYNLVLQANFFKQRNTKEDVEKAINLYKLALAEDPGNAAAWVSLSRCRAMQAGYGYGNLEEAILEAKHALEQALAIDNNLAIAHAAMGRLKLAYEFDWDGAGQALRRAQVLAPGDSEILTGLAVYEAVRDNLVGAVNLARQAVELDPLNPAALMLLGRVSAFSNHLDEAGDAHRKVLELSPNYTSAHANLALVYILMGQVSEALAEAEKEKSNGYRYAALVITYYALGRKDDSNKALIALKNEGEKWGVQIAIAYAYRDESDKAFEWLNRSYELHDGGIQIVRNHPLFAKLKRDPRWAQFLTRVGLVN